MLLRWLERKFGRVALPNIAALLIAPKAAFFLWAWMEGQGDQKAAVAILAKLLLVPQLVLDGEVWRLVTFVIAPPTVSPLWFLIYAFLLFLYCHGLQARWGTVRLYAYVLVGWLTVVVTSFLAMLLDLEFGAVGGFFGVEATLMLGFATFYPDFILRLFFILPVKVKWLAWLTVAGGVLAFVRGPWDTLASYAPRLMILGVFGNYLLFFGPALVRGAVTRQKATGRRRQFEDAMQRGYEERDRLADEDRERDREEADR